MEASRCLLGETTQIINSIYSNYIIIGGWTPYLKYNTNITHPGTKDVDVLFNGADKEDAISEVALILLRNGYLLSAKHCFQLIKTYNIQGKEMAFNVDLLHPIHGSIKDDEDLFIKQLELSIPVEKYQSDTFKVMSIVQPNTKYLFELTMFENYELRYHNSDGVESAVEFNLMNDIGCLLTKSQSCNSRKRTRDSFDIYLTIKQNENYEELISKVLKLKECSCSTYNSLYGIRSLYEDNSRMFSNVKRYYNNIQRSEFDKDMENFFKETELNREAENKN
jgi:hypothetical protein